MSWWKKKHPQIFLSSKKQKFTGAPISELPINFCIKFDSLQNRSFNDPPEKKNTWVFPKNSGVSPKMDGENNVKNPIKMGWFGGIYPLFSETSTIFRVEIQFHHKFTKIRRPEPATLRWLEVELVIRPHSEWRPSHENQRRGRSVGSEKNARPPKQPHSAVRQRLVFFFATFSCRGYIRIFFCLINYKTPITKCQLII